MMPAWLVLLGLLAVGGAAAADPCTPQPVWQDDPVYELVDSGRLYASQARYDLAITAFDQAILLRPSLSAAYLERGRALAEFGLYAEAILDLSLVIEAEPD
jgi:tetratricopeptide (TPR) repeat protein